MENFDDFPDDLLLAALESTEKPKLQLKPRQPAQPSTTTTTQAKQPQPQSSLSLTTTTPATPATLANTTPKLAASAGGSIQQPVPQRLRNTVGPNGRPAAPGTPSVGKLGAQGVGSATTMTMATGLGGGITQPRPQAVAKPSLGANIVVSPRQKGNPVLTFIKKCGWEYKPDIEPDYILGVTTCALFLSLKYHRLHPEYVYKRIKDLHGKYNLRILLALVDIPDHHDSLRELSKTSLINNVTLICAWSAPEAAHYLETYKLTEHSNHDSIKGQQSGNYIERIFNFVTAVPGLNRNEALGLILNFGSLRNGVNAGVEELGRLEGWGDVKVGRWREAVAEPFHPRKKGRLDLLAVEGMVDMGVGTGSGDGAGAGRNTDNAAGITGTASIGLPIQKRTASVTSGIAAWATNTMTAVRQENTNENETQKGDDAVQKSLKESGSPADPALSAGVAAALAKFRQSS